KVKGAVSFINAPRGVSAVKNSTYTACCSRSHNTSRERILRHDVEVYAGRRRLCRHAARRERHFLHRGLIDEMLLSGAAGIVVGRIERHAVPIGVPVIDPAVVAHQVSVGITSGSTDILNRALDTGANPRFCTDLERP